jgi:hypothetical protein
LSSLGATLWPRRASAHECRSRAPPASAVRPDLGSGNIESLQWHPGWVRNTGNEQTLDRPGWWGPDWRTLPLALWLTLLGTGVVFGVTAWIVLKQAEPAWFDTAKRNFRGGTPGDYVVSLIAAACTLLTLMLWLWYLRRRGGHGFERPNHRYR